jgi:hypothetical protein
MKSVAIAYAVIYGLAILLAAWGGGEVRRFLRQTPRIADPAALERFKSMARRNMRFALGQIVLLLTGILVGMILILVQGLTALLPVLLTNGVLVAAGKSLSRFEKRARSLPAATPALAEEHRRVSESWVRRLLPDF